MSRRVTSTCSSVVNPGMGDPLTRNIIFFFLFKVKTWEYIPKVLKIDKKIRSNFSLKFGLIKIGVTPGRIDITLKLKRLITMDLIALSLLSNVG